MEIKGKCALVTGGASGVGLCCVRELLRCGAKYVAICDYDEMIGASALKDLNLEFGPDKVIFIKSDVTDDDELEDAFKKAMSAFKSLDIVLCITDDINDIDNELELAINYYATLRCILLALRYMGKDKGGHGGVVCNTSSMSYMRVFANLPLYLATTQGCFDLCRSLGQPFHYELTGVRVVTMCPGQPERSREGDPSLGLVDITTSPEMEAVFTPTSLLKPEAVAEGMMTLVREATSGSVWVCEGGNSIYELTVPLNV